MSRLKMTAERRLAIMEHAMFTLAEHASEESRQAGKALTQAYTDHPLDSYQVTNAICEHGRAWGRWEQLIKLTDLIQNAERSWYANPTRNIRPS